MYAHQVHLFLILQHIELSRDAGKLIQLHNSNEHLCGSADDFSYVRHFWNLLLGAVYTKRKGQKLICQVNDAWSEYGYRQNVKGGYVKLVAPFAFDQEENCHVAGKYQYSCINEKIHSEKHIWEDLPPHYY